MICPQCHTHNNYYHRYCCQCGVKLDQSKDLPAFDRDILSTHVIFNQGQVRHKRHNRLRLGLITLCAIPALAVVIISLPQWRGFREGEAVDPSAYPSVTAEPTPTPDPLFLELEEPANGWQECSSEQSTIRVLTNAQTLQANGETVQTAPDSTGHWQIPVTLSDYGSNPVILTAVGSDGQYISSQVILYRRYPGIPLTMDDEQQLTTEDGALTMTGSTLPGTTMAVSTCLACGALSMDESGHFSLDIMFPVIPGEYDFAFTLSAPGYEDTRYAWTLTRLLDEKVYADAASDYDYSALMGNPEPTGYDVIRIKGEVGQVLDQTGSNTFIFLVGGREDQPVLVEYTGQTSMEPGDRRTLYGEHVGIEQDMPKILVRLGYRR